MSDLKEYLELKEQYEKFKIIIDQMKPKEKWQHNEGKITCNIGELSGWFLVKMKELEKKSGFKND